MPFIFPGPRRIRTRFLILTPFLILLYWHLHHNYLPDKAVNVSNISSVLERIKNIKTRPPKQIAVEHETQDTPEFQFHSPFRDAPDVEFEEMVDLALRKIEKSARSAQGTHGQGNREGEEEGWPKKIWQVWLSKGWRPGDPDNGGFGPVKEGKEDQEDQKVQFMKAWKSSNPDYEHTLITDLTADNFVSTFYSSIPALVHLYRTLPMPVMKADLLRYLLLFAHGGVWLDHDVYPVKPLSTCPFDIHLPSSKSGISPYTSLLAGVEIDEPYVTAKTRKTWHWSRIYGFIQYHIVAKPFSPFLRKAIVRVVAHAYAHAQRKNTGVGKLWSWMYINDGVWTGKYSEVEVLEITGPGVWTDAILDTLTEGIVKSSLISPSLTTNTKENLALLDIVDGKQRVTWRPFTRIKKPKQLIVNPLDGSVSGDGDEPGSHDVEPLGIYILPINIWGNGQRHSNAKNFRAKEACVNHLFLRSWKKGWWEWAFG